MGSALGLVIDFGDSTKWPFAAGAILAGLWIAIATLLSWRASEGPWLVVASRILGSWLIAIGANAPCGAADPPAAILRVAKDGL